MSKQRDTILAGGSSILAMVLLITHRTQVSNNATLDIFGIDWVIASAIGVIIISTILTASILHETKSNRTDWDT
jgi:hypothetical protein